MLEQSSASDIGAEGNTKTSAPAKKQANDYTYWFITWNNYTLAHIALTLQVLQHECDWFILQEEMSKENTPHIQGTMKLKKKKRLTSLKKIDQTIHWEPTKQITSSCYYCSRIDKRVGEIWTHNFDIPFIPDEVFEPYGWQLKVLEIINNKPHPRHINWFWSTQGGLGKSQMAIWLSDYKNALLCMGKGDNIFHIMTKEPNRRKIFVFDIAKDKMEHFQYSNLELIKNGYIMSGKYNGSIIRFNRPHIIVFANIYPDTSKFTVEDRWNIIKIEKSNSDEKILHNRSISFQTISDTELNLDNSIPSNEDMPSTQD